MRGWRSAEKYQASERDIVLGLDHGAGHHLPRLSPDGGHPVHELERRPGKAGDLPAGVEDPVGFAETLGRLAVTVGKDLLFGVDGRLADVGCSLSSRPVYWS